MVHVSYPSGARGPLALQPVRAPLADLDQPAHLGLGPPDDHQALAVKGRLDRANCRGTRQVSGGNVIQVEDQAFGA